MPDGKRPWFTKHTLLAALGLTLLFLGLLYLEGRPAWCKYGIGVWTAVRTHCTSQHLGDPYTLTHILHGVIFYWLVRLLAPQLPLHWKVLVALGIEMAWEVLENSPWVIERYRQNTIAFDYTGDSILNALGDVIASVLGIAFAHRFSCKAAIVLFIVIELWMLYLARDNLTLNVIMFFYPFQAIKEWQLS